MPDTPVLEAWRSPEPWAEVRADDRVMRYRRSGIGPPVLVLHSPTDPRQIWPELLEALGAGYRLIVPEAPPDDEDVVAWVGGFLEGLGATSVRIVAAGRFSVPALELSLLETAGITRMVLVVDGPSTADQRRGFLRSATGGTPVPLLVVRRAQSADEGVALITDFLRQETSTPA